VVSELLVRATLQLDTEPSGDSSEAILVLSKLAYLAPCHSIQLLALLARGDAPMTLGSSSCGISSPCSAARAHDPNSGPVTVLCSPRSAGRYPGPVGRASLSRPRRCCPGTGGSWPAPEPTRTADQGDHHWTRSCSS
jgi:hypothetical protein